MNHTKWMSKAIYGLKMYIFRQEINTLWKNSSGRRKIDIFIAVLYAKLWFMTSNLEKARATDLQFLIDSCQNSLIDKKVQLVALKNCILLYEKVKLNIFALRDICLRRSQAQNISRSAELFCITAV